MIDVEFGELPAELLEGVVVVDVFTQEASLAGWHSTGAIGSIAPDLQLVVRAELAGFAVFANCSLPIFLGKGSGLHGGDGGNAFNDLLAVLSGG